MWFGTADGLNRYGGAGIKVYRRDPDNPSSLSHNFIQALFVDQSGILWVGTWGGGLNQYDRDKDAFIRYQHESDDPHSLSNNNIRTVYGGQDGTIWIGTIKGLNKLDRNSRQFTHYRHAPDDPHSLSNNTVWSVFEDSTGDLWVGTEDGLNRFDPKTEQFTHFRHDPDDPASLSHNMVKSINEDHSGNLWVGTDAGLCKFNPETNRFTRYQHDPTDPQSLSKNLVRSIYVDRAGTLWVGTWGGGLDRFNQETATFTRYKNDTADPNSLSGSNIETIYESRQGMLWIATDNGVSIFDGRAKPFHHYRVISDNPNSLSHNSVRALHADGEGFVWVGTNGGGLDKFDRQTEQFTHYRHDPADPNSLINDSIISIYADQTGLIWVSTVGKGLSRFDPDTNRFTNYQHDATNPHSLSNDSVTYIYEDWSDTLWIGTYGGGLNTFDRESEQFTRYQYNPADPHSLSNNMVTNLLEDRTGVLWVGTMGGLNKFDRETKTFTHYNHISTDPQSLANDSVVSMHEDRKGTLWIGSMGGIDKFNRKNGQFTHYTTANGLPNENIWGILEDKQGRLWLSTSNGLSRFDPRTETFRNYSVSDGLQSNTFLYFSAYSKSPSGEMYFGGSNGFNAFYPDQIVDNSTPPSVMITGFQLANKSVPIGGDSVLQKSILDTDALILSYLDQVFSFEFAALSHRAAEKNRYRYRMEGLEKEWNEVDSKRRFATYTHLDPGEYVFRVIASNNDGVWNEEGASIKITITPPWWETIWFRISMVLVTIGLLAGGFRWRVKAIEARSRELEIQVMDRTEELQKSKEDAETANRAKSTFLSNMSHELRTPLNAILGFARLLTRDSDMNREQQERLSIINYSGKHLLEMIDDILSLSKIEAGRIELKQEVFGVTQMLQDVGRMMKSRAEGKGLRFTLALDRALPPYVHGDAGKLRQVLINLLGNAVKFTETGEVWLRARAQPMADNPGRVMLRIEVQDTGPGIPRDRLDEVFDTFAQLEHTPNTEGGAGLGLAISRTLVNLMDGEIRVESEPGEGALFTVGIPLQLAEAGPALPGEPPAAEVIGLASGQPDWRILVVDDNRENRLLLGSLISRVGFNIQEASNGEEAIRKYKQWHPHFIWMDMRMPLMDGYAATRKIRELPGGDEVKIVAVTASVLAEDREPILASGCYDVVRKPFREQEIFDAMARCLDVQYRYEESEGETDRKQGIELTSGMLAELPPELLEELRQTTLILDREATLQVIERLEAQAPDTAEGLRILVHDFQMGRLGELLREKGDRGSFNG